MANVDHGHHVRVLYARGDAGLVEEAEHELLVVDEVRVQDLDRDVARETELAARATALAAAEAIHADLSGHAVAARRHRPQDPQLRGESRWMVLNGAYLVDDDIAEAFAVAVAACADRYRDVTIESTGPWPPYSFADIEDDADLTQGPL